MTALPPTVAALTSNRAFQLAQRAFALADDQQWHQLDAAVPPGLEDVDLSRAYVAAAMAMDPPLLTAADLPEA